MSNIASPSVLVFSGHMIDLPDRARSRFPPALEEAVSRRIRTEIIRNNGRIAYAAAASGSDILFLEQSLTLDREINIVLPVGLTDFKEQSVKAAGAGWLHRFDRVVAHAANTQVLCRYSAKKFTDSLLTCNRCLCELAIARAKQENMEVCGLAVLDNRQPGHHPGGTASMIALWQQQDIQYSCIFLDKLRGKKIQYIQ